MGALGRLFGAALAVLSVLVRVAVICAAAWLVVLAAFWVSPWLGWPVLLVATLIAAPRLFGALLSVPLVAVAAFAERDASALRPPDLCERLDAAHDAARARGASDEEVLEEMARAAEVHEAAELAEAEREAEFARLLAEQNAALAERGR